MTSSIYPFEITGINNVSSGQNIFTPSIEITQDMVSPGGGGILRFYFAFDFSIADAGGIDVFKGTTENPTLVFKGTLNPDNGLVCQDNGYYRFDIDVENGDIINLQPKVLISNVNLIRAHLVVFGA